MNALRRVLTLVAFALSVNASASRFEFVVRAHGERLPGAEVCFYPGDPATSASLLFGTSDVRCVPADKIIDVPPGVWNFYARHDDGWVTAHASTIVERDSSDRYHGVTMELVASAQIIFTGEHDPQDRFAAYVPMAHGRAAPPAFPLRRGSNRLEVPAEEPFVLLRVRRNRPIAAGPLTILKVGEVADAESLLPPIQQRDLIAWILVADSSRRAVTATAPPVVRLISPDGTEHRPLYDMEASGTLHRSLVIFREVIDEVVSLRLTGRDWRTYDQRVNLSSRREGTFLDAPLVARLPQRVTVSWDLPAGVRELPESGRNCDSATGGREYQVTVKLLSCPGWRDPETRPADLHGCLPEAEEVVRTLRGGSVDFDLLAPGGYAAVVEAGASRIGRMPVYVRASEDVATQIRPSWLRVFGRLTEGGEPLRAVLQFRGGSAVADFDGRFDATVAALPASDNVVIEPCDGSPAFEHIPSAALNAGGPYDIDIPRNRLTVRVRDAKSGRPIPNASVGRGLFESAAEASASGGGGDAATDESGTVVFRRLEPGYFLRVCAEAEGYSPPRCAKPVRLQANTVEDITIDLEPRNLRAGRVDIPGPFSAASLWRTRADGRVVEAIRVHDDGSFSFSGDLAADYLVFTAARRPLFVAPHPLDSGEGTMVVTPPPGRVRTFSVGASERFPSQKGLFTIAIGSAVVPLDAIGMHITVRGGNNVLEPGGRTTVREVIESAPLRVVYSFGVTPWPRIVEDLFLTPQYAAMLRTALVPAEGELLLEP
jgi:hypothetical protein